MKHLQLKTQMAPCGSPLSEREVPTIKSRAGAN
jgi:hypothetical protein